jgi:hypothetical protein
MAKGKKRVKRAKSGPITITVPDEVKALDKTVIQGIVEMTLGSGSKFGIDEVIVQASDDEGDGMTVLWDKSC